MSSELQQEASRTNGAKSHGALSPETQAICAKNSLKHGLTAKTISLTEEEREDYTNLVNITFNHYRPISSMEKHVIQSVADLEWKIVKADIYEAGILANGRMSNQGRPQRRRTPRTPLPPHRRSHLPDLRENSAEPHPPTFPHPARPRTPHQAIRSHARRTGSRRSRAAQHRRRQLDGQG
jgi:hypothetical protein